MFKRYAIGFQNFFTATEAEDSEVSRTDLTNFSPIPRTPPKRRQSESNHETSKPLIPLHELTPSGRGRSTNLPSSTQKSVSSLRAKLEEQLGGDVETKTIDIISLMYQKVCNLSTQVAEQSVEI